MAKVESCAVCAIPASHRCSGCQQVFYCGRDHQRQHWKQLHRKECHCYKLSTNATLGRHLVATRAIRSGEVIFRESPLLLGPKIASVPRCLGCHQDLTPTSVDGIKKFYTCQHCGWPLCSQSCESSSHHIDECQLLASKSYRPQICFDEANVGKKLSAYCAIVPLRAVLLKRKEPQRYAKVTNMESHIELRKTTKLYAAIRANTVPFILGVLGLDNEATEDELMNIAGIFDTNSYEIRLPERGIMIRALYELGAMMAHCCQPNTKHFFDDDLSLVLIAAVDIPKDEVISISYAQPLQATIQRRFTIKQAKCFECGCTRCADPTELGTYAGSIVCPNCHKAMVVATNPLDFQSDWRCQNEKCYFRESAQQYITRNESFRSEISQLSGSSRLAEYEHLLDKFQSTPTLHPWNTHVLQVKYALSQLYGAAEPGAIKFDDLSEVQLRRKVTLCVDLLQLANLLEPGMSPFCTKLLIELRDTLLVIRNILGSSFERTSAITVKRDSHQIHPQHRRSDLKTKHLKHANCQPATPSPSTMKQQLECTEKELSRMMESDPTLQTAFNKK